MYKKKKRTNIKGMKNKLIIIFLFALVTIGVNAEMYEVITPSIQVGDTLRYEVTVNTKIYHGTDSVVSLIKLFPEVIVESKNDEGFVIVTRNKPMELDVVSSNPNVPDFNGQSDEIKNLTASISLKIQLNKFGKPDTILNMDELKKAYIDGFLNVLKKQNGEEITDEAKWEEETKPFVMAYVDMFCNTEHNIAEQFGNTAFYNFIGIPLKDGDYIQAPMVLTPDMQKMMPGIKKLKMSVTSSNGEDGYPYVILEVKGKKGKNSVEGSWGFSKGKISLGSLYIEVDNGTEILKSLYSIIEL